MASASRLLLVGNSRWHWAQRHAGALQCWHQPAAEAMAQAVAELQGAVAADLRAWAAVGALPPELPLPAERRLGLEQVPLRGLPAWLGIDRALVGWRAWQQQQAGVLVADAGTALSLTWIEQQGTFRGGRISAGVALQLRALAQGTARLPDVARAAALEPVDLWPQATEAAMGQGCLQAVAAAIEQAWCELALQPQPPAGLWLTGGDAALLHPLLAARGVASRLAPDLALESLAALSGLSSEPDR